KMNISRSILIKASENEVFAKLNDFNHWPKWSPWLIMDPDAKITIREDAKFYEWEGKRVGAGSMIILSEEENKSINYDLKFLKPWKSTAKVSFRLEEAGTETMVTWTMDSSLPFFMFWMKKMMEGFVGADYERGLKLLKDYVELEGIESKLEFRGIEDFPGAKYIGIKRDCSIDDIGPTMEADFGKLREYIDQSKDVTMRGMYSIYHKWDIVKSKVSYTACVDVDDFPTDLPSGMITGTIPATKINVVRHIGRYDHLGAAWSAQMNMARGKEFKAVKGIHPFECYLNNPGDTEAKDLITDICFAVK
ncbi:MAG: SRPBCC family protein, partial [Balneolales bacterium]|nr:SRPBCC family protein [Balneolales bacterium]